MSSKTVSPQLLGYFSVPDNHAALAGHFPGNPMVPGVVTLRHALDLLTEALPQTRINGASKIKFMHPLRALQSVRVEMTQHATSIQLHCALQKDETPVLDARLHTDNTHARASIA